MKIGVTLPSFRDDAEAVDSAVVAERMGLDGVFVFDHLWPMGQPQRPALSAMPLLGAVCAATENVTVGSLVARIGLLPDDVLVSSLLSLHRMSEGRFIAGMGVGDHMSASENIAFGVPFAPTSERLSSLRWCATRLREQAIEVWIGCGSHRSSTTIEIAAETGSIVNVWNSSPEDVAWLNEQGFEGVTWGGFAGRGADKSADVTADDIADHLVRLANAGATWAVSAWPKDPEALATAARRVRDKLRT
jgi:alkanesulfonate monooxygenase SsuD/methylene tetrahydromethanopterin reductase-like flavin-dependent oxidoreductase (luciferase family)